MSDTQTGPDARENDETEQTDTDTTEVSENASETQPDGDTSDSDTFPREYVETLRKESAGYRDRAKTAEDRADALAKQLHTALVTATGALVDPDALAFDAEHLDSPGKLSAAIDALISAKPYLKARKPSGDAGQGPRGTSGDTVPKDFAGFFHR